MKYSTRAVVVSLLIAGSAPLFAQNNAAKPLEHVSVTGSRTPVSLWEAGSSIDIIDAQELERRQSPYLVDILRQVPGLSVSQQGGAGKLTQIRVRGAEANQVLVMVDGIEVNDLTRADDFDFSSMTTSDIERIEVVRGPQSSLWGSDALAGVINIITKQTDKPLEIAGSVEAGSFGTKQYTASVGHAGDSYRVRVGANHLNAGGTNVAVNGDEDDGYRNTSINAKADWQAHDSLRLDSVARVTDIHNETDSSGFGVVPVDSDARTDTFEAYVAANARLSLFSDQWQHKLGGAWTRSDNRDIDQLTGSLNRVQGDKISIDYQTSVLFSTPAFYGADHVVTFALDYEKRNFKQRGPISFGADPNQDRKIDTIGYIGEYRLRLFDATSLSASVRHDDNSDFRNATTFRVALSQRLSPWGTIISGAYGTGQKDPTFFDRFGFSSGGFFPFVGNSNLKPEKSRGWEVSIKQPLWDERVTVGATYFSERLKDEINGFVIDFVNGTSTAQNLDGKSHRDGIEIFADAQITSNITAAASYTYLDANEIDGRTGLRVDEIRRPRHSGSASANYSFSNGRGNLNLHITHSGQQLDNSFTLPFFTPLRVNLDAFTLVGLSGSWQIDDYVTLFARGENLIDDDYQEVFGFEAPGAAVYAGLRMRLSK